MLEVGNRVDAGGKGDLPRLFRQVLYCGEHRSGKDLAAGGRQDEQDVVVLTIDVLQFIKGLELRVILAEEHAVVGIEPQKSSAAGGGGHQQHGDQHDEPAPADHPPAIGLYRAVEGAVFRHGVRLPLCYENHQIGCKSGKGIIRDNRVRHYRDRRNQGGLASPAQVPLVFLSDVTQP